MKPRRNLFLAAVCAGWLTVAVPLRNDAQPLAPTDSSKAGNKARALTLQFVHPPDKVRQRLQAFDFESVGTDLIHRPGPEHFKLTRLDNGKDVSLMIAYRQEELEPENTPRPGGRNGTKLAYNSLFKGVRLRLDSGTCDVKGPPAADLHLVQLFARAPLEPGVRYRLTWACWPVGAAQATEISCDFALGTPAPLAIPSQNANTSSARWEEILRLEDHKRTVRWMAFSPDATLLATGTTDGQIHIWDKEVVEAISAVAFSPDGRLLACTNGVDGTLWLRDAMTGKEVRRLSGHTTNVASLTF